MNQKIDDFLKQNPHAAEDIRQIGYTLEAKNFKNAICKLPNDMNKDHKEMPQVASLLLEGICQRIADEFSLFSNNKWVQKQYYLKQAKEGVDWLIAYTQRGIQKEPHLKTEYALDLNEWICKWVYLEDRSDALEHFENICKTLSPTHFKECLDRVVNKDRCAETFILLEYIGKVYGFNTFKNTCEGIKVRGKNVKARDEKSDGWTAGWLQLLDKPWVHEPLPFMEDKKEGGSFVKTKTIGEFLEAWASLYKIKKQDPLNNLDSPFLKGLSKALEVKKNYNQLKALAPKPQAKIDTASELENIKKHAL